MGAASTTWTLALLGTTVDPVLWLISTKTWPHTTASRHRGWDASSQATNWVGTQPHLSAHKLKTSRAQSHLWTLPCPAEGPGPSSTHQWVGTSPRTPWAPTLSSMKSALTFGPASPTRGQIPEARNPQSHSLLTQSAPSRLPWDQLGPDPAH